MEDLKNDIEELEIILNSMSGNASKKDYKINTLTNSSISTVDELREKLEKIKTDYYSLSGLSGQKKKIKLPGFENSDKIDNYGSLYVQDFEIKKIKDNNIQPKVCIFNNLPENNLNPFLVYAKSNDLHKKKIIDLRNLKNTEEQDFFFLNDILSQ